VEIFVNKMRRAFTFIEIIVSVLILALVVAALANIFVASRRYIIHNRSRLQASEFNKRILDIFYKAVREDEWWTNPNNPLYVNQPGGTNLNRTADTGYLNNLPYTSQYNVTDLNSSAYQNATLRKVKMVVNWTEPFK